MSKFSKEARLSIRNRAENQVSPTDDADFQALLDSVTPLTDQEAANMADSRRYEAMLEASDLEVINFEVDAAPRRPVDAMGMLLYSESEEEALRAIYGNELWNKEEVDAKCDSIWNLQHPIK
jgi:hypothetical protein